jgi:hypothetical protein
VGRIDDQYVCPFDEPLEDLGGGRRFEIEDQSALVAVVEVPRVVVVGARLRRDLVPHAPRVARRRLDFDHVRAEVAQDDRRARTGDEARQVDDLQSRKDVVSFHG